MCVQRHKGHSRSDNVLLTKPLFKYESLLHKTILLLRRVVPLAAPLGCGFFLHKTHISS